MIEQRVTEHVPLEKKYSKARWGLQSALLQAAYGDHAGDQVFRAAGLLAFRNYNFEHTLRQLHLLSSNSEYARWLKKAESITGAPEREVNLVNEFYAIKKNEAPSDRSEAKRILNEVIEGDYSGLVDLAFDSVLIDRGLILNPDPVSREKITEGMRDFATSLPDSGPLWETLLDENSDKEILAELEEFKTLEARL